MHPDDEANFDARIEDTMAAHLGRLAVCLKVFGAFHPAEPAWFLQFVGVRPDRQGRGIGSALLDGVLTRADAALEPAWLVATSARNRALYERHGFACVRDLTLPDGPTAFAMWREPVGSPRSAGPT